MRQGGGNAMQRSSPAPAAQPQGLTSVSWLLCSALARLFCSSVTCAEVPACRAASSRSSGVSPLLSMGWQRKI